tara:strand:- start:303 stop:734 length:432 start_codon:yes stop_codon:yes gene_type:complete
MSIKKPSKAELLAKYPSEDPEPFIQLDGSFGCNGCNSRHPDKDGYCLTSGSTDELLSNPPDVRVIIKPAVDKKTVVALLSKITSWVKKDLENLDDLAKEQWEIDRVHKLVQLLNENNFTYREVRAWIEEGDKNVPLEIIETVN